jgi:hypothetical protein
MQYLIFQTLLKEESEKNLPMFPDLISKRSARIKNMRTISAVMALGSAIILFAFACLYLRSLICGLIAAGIFIINPASLFYSHTSNMEQPYIFWWLTSLFLCFVAEFYYKDNKKKYWTAHFFTGVCIAFAFCTKDQVYASYILPTLYYVYLMRQAGRKTGTILFNFCIWGIAFLLFTCAIYYLAGGWDSFVYHFKWITTGGSAPFAQESAGISGRLRLFLASLANAGGALDWPLIILLFLGCGFFIKNKKTKSSRSYLRFIILLITLFFSINIFFQQIIRYTFLRFELPLLPIACLMSGLLLARWKKLRLFVRILSVAAIAFMIAIACQFLYSMNNDSRVSLRKSLQAEELLRSGQKLVAATGSASGDIKVFQNGECLRLKRLQNWMHSDFGIIVPRQKSIDASRFSLAFLKPDILITKGDIPNDDPLFKRTPYNLIEKIIPKKNYIWTLNPYNNNSQFFIYAKVNGGDKNAPLEDYTFEEQVIRIQASIDIKQMNRQISLLGKELKPFQDPDLKKYFIDMKIIHLCAHSYNKAGRNKDAAAAYAFLVKYAQDNQNAMKDAKSFFQKHPELAREYLSRQD